MIIVGLTGNVASGKSTVAAFWREWGVPVVSADELARQAVAPGSDGLAQVVEVFGDHVLTEDGHMDRAAVRKIVFDDSEALRTLEGIIHPEVRALRDRWTDERQGTGADLVVWEIPLLFETGMEDDVDVVVLVDAPAPERLDRIVRTRGLTEAEGEAIMAAQMPADEKRSRAHILIDNDSTLATLEERAREVLTQLQTLEV